MIYFKFEKREPKPVEYKTLADVPEGVRCICTVPPESKDQIVRIRIGEHAYNTKVMRQLPAVQYTLLQVLDPVPAPSTPKTYADVEEGRCFRVNGGNSLYWTWEERAYSLTEETGAIAMAATSVFLIVQSLTDTYAVRCEVDQ